jgi:hypothetical protein
MATTIWMESGTDATQGFEFYSSTSGTITSDSTVSHTGSRSIKIDGVSAGTADRTGVLADAGRRISFWFRFDTLPSAAAIVASVKQSGGTNIFTIAVNTTGTLRVTPVGATLINGTIALNTNTWYRICLSYTITSTSSYTAKLFLNGKLEITASNVTSGTMTNVTSDRWSMASSTNFGSGKFVWFDDVFIDNGTTLDDPGNIIVTNKRPNANGALNGFTTQIGSGGSGYGSGHSPQVNEQPLSTTNGWSIASASALTEEYTIEGAATGDKDVSNPRFSLVDYMGWIYAKTNTAGTRNIIVNGSATNISTTTAYALYTKVAGSATYPSGNTAIGMNNNSVNNLTSLAECGILLAYKLPRRVMVST